MQERAHPVQYVIATLLVVNLALTAWLLVRSSNVPESSSSEAPSLPTQLTHAERSRLFGEVQQRFNSQDSARVYAFLDEFARSQLSESEMVSQVDKLKALFGSILSGSYSHYEFAGSQGERSFFKLYYNVKLAAADFPQGQAILTVTSTGNDVGLVGFHLSSNTQ